MTNIILCGGSGTRLWPISRTLMPKQFVKLFDGQSLFQFTIARNAKVCDRQFIVSNTEQYFLAMDQLEELGERKSSYLLEPIGRDTAPAIALACMALDREEIVLVTPSDHLIRDTEAYEKVLQQAKSLASADTLVTFGITPTFAETGFGYIEAHGEEVLAFHEKPDRETAQNYIDAGHYYWNSGMFMFRAGVFLEELETYAPDIYRQTLRAIQQAKSEEGLIRICHEDMMQIPQESIDYAVMEKSDRVKVVVSDIGWSDVGSFDALAQELPNDQHNNLVISSKIVKTIDIHDTIIVDTSDALLVVKKGSSQKVKQVVDELNEEGSTLPNLHLTGYRPWGSYTILEDANGYKIKRIEVKAGRRLSLQKHAYRNEHWVVVSGTATVTVNGKTFLLKENESTYIRAGDIHRLANETAQVLVVIEAQVGSYTGEDDIIRLDDDFNRQEDR